MSARHGRPTGQHYYRNGEKARKMKARLRAIVAETDARALRAARARPEPPPRQPDSDLPVPDQEGD